MKAAVFLQPEKIALQEMRVPAISPGDALVKNYHHDDLRHRYSYLEG
jgi:hypothetical protein